MKERFEQEQNKKSPINAKDKNLWKRFIINISLVILLFVMGMFIGIMVRNNQLINKEILSKTKSYFKHILLTRRWNANYGGVYVEKKEGMKSNPYLENPDIHTVEGKVYTRKNPALMTREISALAEKSGEFRFHITSLKPLNPDNKADEFETSALNMFNKGTKEHYTTVNTEDKSVFRYMGPLLVEKNCMSCHAIQGYKVGDIRGGISVTVDVTDIRKTIKLHNSIIIILSVLTAVFLLGIIYHFVRKLNTRLTRAYERIEVMAMIDDLTRLYNRRYFFARLQEEFHRARRYNYYLGCILIDLDHFKEVNDKYGHLGGDVVLKRTADAIKEKCRQTDIVARYGGEEVIVMLPDSPLDATILVAEKIREHIEAQSIGLEGGTKVKITASFGVSGVTPNQLQNLDDHLKIIKDADKALYLAKANGRNRVEFSGK